MLDASLVWREIVFYWGYTSFIVTITTVPVRGGGGEDNESRG